MTGFHGLTGDSAGRGINDRQYARELGRTPEQVVKALTSSDSRRLAEKYGTKGPLPKSLSRDERMKAYEARYNAAGGPKGEKWNRRVKNSEVARNIGLAGATVSSAAMLAARTKRGAKLVSRLPKGNPKAVQRQSENVALGTAVGGGAAELYGEHARSRRASYRNSPAGVARSALTRMKAYTPGDS